MKRSEDRTDRRGGVRAFRTAAPARAAREPAVRNSSRNCRTTAPAARPRLSIATAEPKALPLTALKMERHVHSSQAFTPLDCASYLVMVAPHGDGGMPDLEKIRAFRVPGRHRHQLQRRHLASSAVAARTHRAGSPFSLLSTEPPPTSNSSTCRSRFSSRREEISSPRRWDVAAFLSR